MFFCVHWWWWLTCARCCFNNKLRTRILLCFLFLYFLILFSRLLVGRVYVNNYNNFKHKYARAIAANPLQMTNTTLVSMKSCFLCKFYFAWSSSSLNTPLISSFFKKDMILLSFNLSQCLIYQLKSSVYARVCVHMCVCLSSFPMFFRAHYSIIRLLIF